MRRSALLTSRTLTRVRQRAIVPTDKVKRLRRLAQLWPKVVKSQFNCGKMLASFAMALSMRGMSNALNRKSQPHRLQNIATAMT